MSGELYAMEIAKKEALQERVRELEATVEQYKNTVRYMDDLLENVTHQRDKWIGAATMRQTQIVKLEERLDKAMQALRLQSLRLKECGL